MSRAGYLSSVSPPHRRARITPIAFVIGMKLGDVAADILFAPVTEQVEFGLVRPEYSAVAGHEMQCDRAILEEILQFLMAPLQLLLRAPVLGDIPQREQKHAS